MNFYGISSETTHGALSGVKLLRQLKPVNVYMNFTDDETETDKPFGKSMLTVTAAFAEEKSSDKKIEKKK